MNVIIAVIYVDRMAGQLQCNIGKYATGKVFQPEAVCRWQSVGVLPWPWYSVMTAIIDEQNRML
jgi:hypothetical protein